MSIGTVDRKLLWGRSANRCSWPGCDIRLTSDQGSPETQLLAERGVVLGEEAHIRSAETAGPRHDDQFPKKNIDTYATINFVITAIRAEFDRFYRFDEGLVLLVDGDVIFGAFLQRVEYASDSELLPPLARYSAFLSSLRAELGLHDSPYGRELDLSRVNVGNWATREESGEPST